MAERVQYRELFIRYDQEDETEPCLIYEGTEELLKETTFFYHENFTEEDNYDENWECTSVTQAVDLWEGNGYGIAQVIKGNY